MKTEEEIKEKYNLLLKEYNQEMNKMGSLKAIKLAIELDLLKWILDEVG